jgi:signal recognition particle receptor subunit beta
MAEVNRDSGTVNARILYWGVEGGGKSTNLRVIHQKLRPDHRGDLQVRRTPLDPTVTYEVLPIELGDVGGQRTRIEVCAVPGAADQAPTRKQLLDRVDGLVFVIDAQPGRIDDNLASFDELRRALGAYGRSIESVPLVIQYNKCDRSDPYALEELHKKLDLRGAAAFEAVASEGTAVLQTLTTISKRVMRVLASNNAAVPAPAPERAPAPPPPPPPAAAAPAAPRRPSLEDAVARESRDPLAARSAATAAATSAILDASEDLLRAMPLDAGDVVLSAEPLDGPSALTLESVGQARKVGNGVVLPIVLRDGEGRLHGLSLTLQITPAGGADKS